MTKQEFETWYATNSGVPIAFLHSLGLQAAPCDCEEPGCQGWQMVHTKSPREIEAEEARA